MTGVSAIVPQKCLALAKSRLEEELAPRDRAAMSRALLRHVCGALRAVPGVEQLTVMTPDATVRAWAATWGCAAAADPAPGLNAALARTVGSAVSDPARRGVLVVAADLPWVRAADVAALLAAARPAALVLAPSKDGTGTGALLIPPGVRFRPAYGDGSRAAHRREARARGLDVIEVVRPGLAFDLDTPADLAMLSPVDRAALLDP